MGLPNIKVIGLYADGITKEEIYNLAKENNKQIECFHQAGTKKNPFLKIDIKK